ncbi:cobalamin biosynthesis protein [Methanonatronarchaeum sp. AMET6-2]|uniref:cobalamin biosynthesis protein n=1 Tax=Methanonatronarchaeum sp. AMET6-2 TaxID=2933293 RepID=UPI0012073546|nr:cobalamin biosynthesis protein [Methanonatronarchaeum sp. AMET6-2]RZN62905.1 MAG: cobalamin biosynthesis protein [Methanonatronarchaeia archaeon]UOY09835.1 cobalamin biosynthesis protein [Methanonatronarchaeum sp. AMET6-2]
MDFFINRIVLILIALAVDMVGEPPSKIHPVVWIGYVIEKTESLLNKESSRLRGITAFLLISFLFVVPAILLEMIPGVIGLLATGVIASTMFSIKNLSSMVGDAAVEDTDKKREVVSGLVSRDTTQLDEGQLNSAAVETGAENITDSVVSPLFFLALFGLPGIVFFRVVNTLDAMIGYKNDRYRDFGWFSARMDDILNFIPSRISGILILLVGWKKEAIQVVKEHRDIKLNPGWTISAISGVLNKKIEKKGYYCINRDKEPPSNEDVVKTVRIIWVVSGIFIIILIGILVVGAYFV